MSRVALLRRLILALFAVVALAGTGVGCAAPTDRAVIAQANTAHGELQKAVVTDPTMANYIQEVGSRVVVTAEQRFEAGLRAKDQSQEDRNWMFDPKVMQFHFVNSQTLNAFTTGGEHMYIYTELLRQCKKESELAAVVAHEYAHVFGRHVHNGMSKQYWSVLAAVAGGAAGYAAGGEDGAGTGVGVGAALAGLAQAGFTRDDEREADELGFRFYVNAGWHPDEFADFFRTLLAAEQKARSGGTPEFMSSHPSTANRVAAAEKLAAEYKKNRPDWQSRLRPPVADPTRFEQLKRRSLELANSMPSDKTLETQKLAMALPRSCLWPDEPHPVSAQKAQQSLQQDMEKKAPKQQR